jgi:hypothetical protein
MWSASGWVSTSRSIAVTPRDRRARTTGCAGISASLGGPASISIHDPAGDRIAIASPCPTSIIHRSRLPRPSTARSAGQPNMPMATDIIIIRRRSRAPTPGRRATQRATSTPAPLASTVVEETQTLAIDTPAECRATPASASSSTDTPPATKAPPSAQTAESATDSSEPGSARLTRGVATSVAGMPRSATR